MSHVYYKFKSQRDPSRVVFDGPAISVFDLKREIITLNKLGNGADFDLSIYDESTNEGAYSCPNVINGIEYTDDNYMIPRATSVVVRRLPPSKPGKGNGAKYVSGIVTTNRTSRSEIFNVKKTNEVTAKSTPAAPKVVSSRSSSADEKPTATDDESAAIAQMMSAQSANWDSQQEKMALANPVYTRKKPLAPVPDKPPPQGYICHRCGEKGHWIQACPTNNDPNFDNKPRIKRTTGIPKTFLKKADKPVFDEDGEGKTSGVMLNADGEYVIVEPDSKSWVAYQAKANALEGDVYSLPLPAEHKDWECQSCGKLVKDATRTPCCKKLYCDQCIQSALLESDFVCPGCGMNEVLLDSLVVDEDVRTQVSEYIKEWEEARKSPSPPPEAKNVSLANHITHLKEPHELISRKRSRSPTPSDEITKKKAASEELVSANLAKSPALTPSFPVGPSTDLNPQPYNMPPFMPPMPGMPFPGMPPFPPFPPDPFMMAAIGFPPPPLPGMMPPMGPGMFPQQGFSQPMGNQLYGGDNSAYMRRPVNERGMRRVQKNASGGPARNADYREVI